MIKTTVVNNALEGFLARRTPAVKAIQAETQEYTLAYEQAICPVLTGNLKDSIHPETEGDVRSVVAGGEQAPYAGFVNDGTDRQAAQPFHDEAAEAGRRYMNEQLKGLK